MKTYILLVAVGMGLLSGSAFADEKAASIKLTSFHLVGGSNVIAEVCGEVSGLSQYMGTILDVTVDYNTSTPGHYTSVLGKSGSFCTMVTTYRGSVNVSFADGTVSARSEMGSSRF